MHSEKTYRPMSGWPVLAGVLGTLFGGSALFVYGINVGNPFPIIGGIATTVAAFISLFGFMAIAPNQSRVLLLFGSYKGSVKESGFYWVIPFYSKKKLSLRVRNFETGSTTTLEKKNEAGQVVTPSSRSGGRPSKVNDSDGNPVDISAVVVWRVVDTAEVLFEVDDYENFMEVQSEAALRVLASRHPYDSDDSTISLRGNPIEVCEQLKKISRSGSTRRGLRLSKLVSATWITLRKLLQRCCSVSRLKPSLQHELRSLKERLAWSTWPLNTWKKTELWNSTRTVKRRWFQTCLLCFAAADTHNPS